MNGLKIGWLRRNAFFTIPLITVLLLVGLSASQKLLAGYPLSPKGFVVPVVFGLLVGMIIASLLRGLLAYTEKLEKTTAALEQSETSLRQEKERYRTVADFTYNWEMWLAPDGKPLYISPSCERITGYRVDEMLTDPELHLKIICPDCTDDILANLANRQTDTCELEYKILRRDGTQRWIAHTCQAITGANGEFAGWRSSNRDITERKKIDATLQRFALVIDQARESVVITGTDGNITYVNPAFERLTGYSLADVEGKNPRILNSGEQEPTVYCHLWETILTGDTWTGQLVNKKKDGSLFTEEATISPLRSPSGEVISYVAVKNDITAELQLKEQLLQSQKMEAIGQLAGGVAHDFNNMLSVIQGYTEIVQQSSTDKSSVEYLQEVQTATERAATLVRQLLAFSRKQVMKKANLDLSAVVGEMVKMIRRIIGEDVMLKTICEPTSLQIHADRGQIEQVVMNLCVNARDAMPGGGELTITTSPAKLDQEFCSKNTWARPGTFLLLSVADTGTGMGNDTLQHIFEPFFTTKEVGKGTGLGLSTVFGIIHQHNGLIQVDSEVGSGTVFNVYLPTSKVAETAAAEASKPSLQNGTETLLLADDNAALRQMISLMLEESGYHVITAPDGHLAIERFEASQDEIALVMLSMVMPGKGGQETYERIRDRNPNLPVLFLTGNPARVPSNEIRESPTAQLLEKPFTREELLQSVRQLLDARVKR